MRENIVSNCKCYMKYKNKTFNLLIFFLKFKFNKYIPIHRHVHYKVHNYAVRFMFFFSFNLNIKSDIFFIGINIIFAIESSTEIYLFISDPIDPICEADLLPRTTSIGVQKTPSLGPIHRPRKRLSALNFTGGWFQLKVAYDSPVICSPVTFIRGHTRARRTDKPHQPGED